MTDVDVIAPGDPLSALRLDAAPAVTRTSARAPRRRPAAAIALAVLGGVLIVGPIAGGLFSSTASGQQMIDAFAPHMDQAALDRYGADLRKLQRGGQAVATTYARQSVPAGRYPGLDQWRERHGQIDATADALLRQVESARPDYEKAAGIGGFTRLPFLLVVFGIVAVYAGVVLLSGRRPTFTPVVVAVLVVAAVVVAYPFLGNVPAGASAGHRLTGSLKPVMTSGKVRQLQDDFVVLVTAVGELDTSFRDVPQDPAALRAIAALDAAWPQVSGDFAALTGAINDNLPNYDALAGLDRSTEALGFSGLRAAPWLMVGAGVLGAGLAIAAWPRRRKETP